MLIRGTRYETLLRTIEETNETCTAAIVSDLTGWPITTTKNSLAQAVEIGLLNKNPMLGSKAFFYDLTFAGKTALQTGVIEQPKKEDTLSDIARLIISQNEILETLRGVAERLEFLSQAISTGLIERRSDEPPVAKEKRAGKEKQEDPFGVKRLYMPNHMKWINAYEAKDIETLAKYLGSFAWWLKQEGNREKWLSYKHGEEQLLTSEWFIANNGNECYALFANGANQIALNIHADSQPVICIAIARDYIQGRRYFND
jgi:hypothetical protein